MTPNPTLAPLCGNHTFHPHRIVLRFAPAIISPLNLVNVSVYIQHIAKGDI